MNQKIIDYLQQNKDQYTKEDLVEALKRAGHEDEEIQEAVSIVYLPPIPTPAPANPEPPTLEQQSPAKREQFEKKEETETISTPVKSSNNSNQKEESAKVENNNSSTFEKSSNVVEQDFFSRISKKFKEIFNEQPSPFLKILAIGLLVKVILAIFSFMKIAVTLGLLTATINGTAVIPYDVLYVLPLWGIFFVEKKWIYVASLMLATVALISWFLNIFVLSHIVIVSVGSANPLIKAFFLHIGVPFDMMIIIGSIKILINKK